MKLEREISKIRSIARDIPFICKIEADENLANIYGIILYTEANPYVLKVLGDEDLWNAIDEISGKRWTIFAVKPKRGRQVIIANDPIKMLSAIWKEPRDTKKVLKKLEITSSKELPLFVVFTSDIDGNVIKCVVRIKGYTKEAIYESIRLIVNTVTNTIEKITQENLKFNENVFREVAGSIDYYSFWERASYWLRLIERIKSWF